MLLFDFFTAEKGVERSFAENVKQSRKKIHFTCLIFFNRRERS